MSAGWDHPLFSAVRHGREHDVRQRLKMGDDINMPSGGLNDYGGPGHTVLHVAIQENRLKMVQLLLDLGADPRRRSDFRGQADAGWSPLALLMRTWPDDTALEWNAKQQGRKNDEGYVWARPQHLAKIAQALLDHDRGLAIQPQAFGDTPLSIAQRRAQDETSGALQCLLHHLVDDDRQVLEAQLPESPSWPLVPGRPRL